MTWFRVDDGFWSHPKTMLMSLEATGLWVRAGAWSTQHLTDGFIPADILRRISPAGARVTDRLAAELEDRGLWVALGDGWQFHDWSDFQMSRDRATAEREANRKRQQRWRDRRWADQQDTDRAPPVTRLARRE